MDSFFDQVQTPPEPISIEKYIYKSSVPEVSMISTIKNGQDDFSSENRWKINAEQLKGSNFQQQFVPIGYKTLQAQFTRKQVRFESPVLQQRDLNNSPHDRKTELDSQKLSAMRKQQLNNLKSEGPQLFEQMYMANIPDRKLDLSLLDIPKNNDNIHCEKNLKDNVETDKSLGFCENKIDKIDDKENCMPKTYKDFLKLQKKIKVSEPKDHNDSVTDIFNYKKNKMKNDLFSEPRSPPSRVLPKTTHQKLELKSYQHSSEESRPVDYRLPSVDYQPYKPVDRNEDLPQKKCECETQTDKDCGLKIFDNKDDYSQSNAYLLKIISQQNEQLLLLQRQVAMLLDRDRRYPQPLEASENREKRDCYYPSTPQQSNHLFRRENVITQQTDFFQDNQRKWGQSKFSINLTTSFEMPVRPQQNENLIHEPKIQEMTESDVSPSISPREPSLHISEPLDVQEPCQSPQPSININMNPYESSDDEDSVSEIGATFYNNLMGQVNGMLKNGQKEIPERENKRSDMFNKVREATLKHLKTIGITLGPMDEECDAAEDNFSPSELSCSVKQLLMKYLPPEQLQQQEKAAPFHQDPSTGIITPKAELSVASLEYMRKYNLLRSKEKVPGLDRNKPTQQNWTQDNKKILDLTALKMQPKLL